MSMSGGKEEEDENRNVKAMDERGKEVMGAEEITEFAEELVRVIQEECMKDTADELRIFEEFLENHQKEFDVLTGQYSQGGSRNLANKLRDAKRTPALRRIHVRGISKETRNEVIRPFFEQFGMVETCIVVRNPGDSTGYASVHFQSFRDVLEVLRTPLKSIGESDQVVCSLVSFAGAGILPAPMDVLNSDGFTAQVHGLSKTGYCRKTQHYQVNDLYLAGPMSQAYQQQPRHSADAQIRGCAPP